MSIRSEEQLALLESIKGTPDTSTPVPLAAPSARTATPPRQAGSIDRGVLPVPEVAQTVGCGVDDVLSILRRLGYMRKTAGSRLTVGEAEAVQSPPVPPLSGPLSDWEPWRANWTSTSTYWLSRHAGQASRFRATAEHSC